VRYVFNKSFRPCLIWYINVRLAFRERQREREMFYLTTLLIAKLTGAQCHWFMNEVRVWSNGRISGVPRNFVRGGGGVQQIQLRTEGRENGDLGAVAP
jgi:hypothetical protein